jgi:hypothetical protein
VLIFLDDDFEKVALQNLCPAAQNSTEGRCRFGVDERVFKASGVDMFDTAVSAGTHSYLISLPKIKDGSGQETRATRPIPYSPCEVEKQQQ